MSSWSRACRRGTGAWISLGKAGAAVVAMRRFLAADVLTLLAAAVVVGAAAVLFTFPQDPRAWQAATWTLVGGLVVLSVLVVSGGIRMARNRAARDWRSIVAFAIGLACLAPFAAALLLA